MCIYIYNHNVSVSCVVLQGLLYFMFEVFYIFTHRISVSTVILLFQASPRGGLMRGKKLDKPHISLMWHHYFMSLHVTLLWFVIDSWHRFFQDSCTYSSFKISVRVTVSVWEVSIMSLHVTLLWFVIDNPHMFSQYSCTYSSFKISVRMTVSVWEVSIISAELLLLL